jgi:hypothetical protein
MTFELTPELTLVKVVNNIRREYVLSPTRTVSSFEMPQFSAIDAIRVNADLHAYQNKMLQGLGNDPQNHQVQDQLNDHKRHKK